MITITIEGVEELQALAKFSSKPAAVYNNCAFYGAAAEPAPEPEPAEPESLKERLFEGKPVDVREAFAAKADETVTINAKFWAEIVNMARQLHTASDTRPGWVHDLTGTILTADENK